MKWPRSYNSSRQVYHLVLDSSSIITLTELDILTEIFKRLATQAGALRVIIPSRVREELKRSSISIDQYNEAYQVMVFNANDMEINLPQGLGEGEKEAILIALSLMKLSNVIVITDDKKARKTCEKLKINVLGTLGLVELLKKHKIISRKEALALIQKIPNTSLYITPQLLEKAQHKIETQKL
ncbi:MAG: hypothetical protein QXW41_03620 [Fervidicoccaceae archaeon]